MCTGGKTWFSADVAGSDRPEEKFPTTSLQKGRWINNKVKNIVEEHDWRLGNEETEDIFKSNESLLKPLYRGKAPQEPQDKEIKEFLDLKTLPEKSAKCKELCTDPKAVKIIMLSIYLGQLFTKNLQRMKRLLAKIQKNLADIKQRKSNMSKQS